jgi:hypothetical protein
VASPSQRKRLHDAFPQDGRRRAQARLIRQEALNSVMGKAVVNSTVQAISQKTLCYEHAIADWCLTRKRTPMMASGERRDTGRT